VKPAGNRDQLPTEVEIRRERRRTVELAMWGGRLIARVPRRIGRAEMDRLIGELRDGLNQDLWKHRVLEDEQLAELAATVAARWLEDLRLPPYQVRFVGRMRKRWASCTVVRGEGGTIHVSRLLRGHPRWVLEHILLHELIHLVVPNHGSRFQRLMARSPLGARADGYLEALEHQEQWGEWLCGEGLPRTETKSARPREARAGQIELFGSRED